MWELSCAHTSNAIAHLQTDSCVGVSGKILVVVVAKVRGSAEQWAFETIEFTKKRWRRNEGNSAAISLFCKFDFHTLGLGKKVFANKITFPFAIVDFWVTLAIELQCS